MDIVADTASYESWLGQFCALYTPDLEYKHARMSDARDPFPFFRGTYYRWAKLWPEICPELLDAPRPLAVGDIHLENYGTWRDADGRLCWGVNDFDEADDLPYTNDLVRLAASARFAKKSGSITVKFRDACAAILDGYRGCLAAGGRPFVLEERHPHLRAVAISDEREPGEFWPKLTRHLAEPEAEPPPGAREALLRNLPGEGLTPAIRFRTRVGMGSLGKPRYVALVEWYGGWVARETKIVTPPATAWATGRAEPNPSRMAEIVTRAIRCHDPFYRPGPEWISRRLGPRCSRIELSCLAAGDGKRVLRAMGAELANIHLGTPRVAVQVLWDLNHRPPGWLEAAAQAMTAAVRREWVGWRAAFPLPKTRRQATKGNSNPPTPGAATG